MTGDAKATEHSGENGGIAGKHHLKRRVWTVVLVVSLVVFLAAMGYLAILWISYSNDANRYQEIAESAFEEPKTEQLADMTVDWSALRAINPEVVGWIYIPNTPVNYPVCWCGDNDKYLTANFDNESGVFTGSGTIFLDKNNNPDFSDQNNTLYGHHMNDGSMFACLSDFAEDNMFKAHRTVYLFTPSKNYRFHAFSLVRTNGSDALVVANFASSEEMAEYVADKQARNMVALDENIAPDEVQKMLTLATCDYNQQDGRAVLFCSLEEEAIPRGV